MICYILHSQVLGKYYTGVTLENVSSRLEKHNESTYGTHYTSQTKDWELYLEIICNCKTQMFQIEKHIKRMKSKVYIENLKKYPEMIEKLKNKYTCNWLCR